jgi:hypothetical protein
MPYTPLLMSSRYVDGHLELVMLRDTVNSVFTFSNGVLDTSAMSATSAQNLYKGETAPSVPYVFNSDMSSMVSLVSDTPDYANGYNRNTLEMYAEARLIYKPNLELYCLIHNNQIFFSSTMPDVYNNAVPIIVNPTMTYYVGPIPASSTAPLTAVLAVQLSNIDSHLTTSLEPSGLPRFTVTPNGGSVVDTPMSVTVDVAPGGFFSGVSAAHATANFFVPPTPAARYLPGGTGTYQLRTYQTLDIVGSDLYAAGALAVAKTSDGVTWTVADTFVVPYYDSTSISNFIGVSGGPDGPVAISNSGFQKQGNYFQAIGLATTPRPAAPAPTGPLMAPFDRATPLVGTSGTINGSINRSDLIYIGYGVEADYYSFTLTTPKTVEFTLTNLTGSNPGSELWMVLTSLTGASGSQVEDFVAEDPNMPAPVLVLNITLAPGTYYILPQARNPGNFASYTLQYQINDPQTVSTDVYGLKHSGDQYIAVIKTPGTFESEVVTSLDLVHWTRYGSAIRGSSGAVLMTDIVTGGGTTMVSASNSLMRILGTDNPLQVLTCQQSWENHLCTDGSGNWLFLNGPDLYASTDDGLNFNQLDLTAIVGGSFHDLSYIAHVNGKFVILSTSFSWPNYTVNVCSATDVNFTSGKTISLNVLPNFQEGTVAVRTFNGKLYMLNASNGSRVRISSDWGQTWGTPRVLSFTAPAKITLGDPAALTWTSAGAVSTSINQGVGSVAANGTVNAYPTVNTTYTLSVVGEESTVTQNVTVQVYAAPVITSLVKTSSSTFSWTTTGTSQVSLDNGIGVVGANSSQSVNPSSTTIYTLSAQNAVPTVVTSTIKMQPSKAWSTIAYGNGTFVAVSYLGEVATSPDGDTWTGRGNIAGYFSGSQAWVKYINGQFAIAADNGALRFSPDGITWTTPSSVPAGAYTAIAYGGGVWVATGRGSGYGAKMLRSTDRNTWTESTSVSNNTWTDVIWDGSKFVAISSDNGCSTSTDGNTWTNSAGVGQSGWRSIAYDGAGHYVVVNGAQGRYTLTSTNGTTWSLNDAATSYQDQKVLWDGTQFLRLRKWMGSNYAIESSPTGTTWTNVSTYTSSTVSPMDMEFGGGYKVVVANSGELNRT